MTRFLDIHILQSVPPSNLNRDDTGSPKTAIYGGVRRSRVSSQAWKRSARKAFEGGLASADLGFRTLRLVKKVADEIEVADPSVPEAERVSLAQGVLEAAGIKLKAPRAGRSKVKETDAGVADDDLAVSQYLVFLSQRQIENLAQLALDARGEKPNRAAAKHAANTDHGIDVSLFGRMVADDATLNVDAAVQVAHAISTHAVSNEFDYYTAVDDVNTKMETGAGMIGTLEFNSATLYRYATINVDSLRANLGDDAATVEAAGAFFTGFVLSMPTGKQNTFANRTLPSLVAVRVRDDQPVNLVGAFESPVERNDDGWLATSAAALGRHASALDAAYGTAGLVDSRVMALDGLGDAVNALGTTGSLDDLTEMVRSAAGVNGA